MPRFSLSVVSGFVFFRIYSVFLSHLFCRFVSVCSCLASDCNVSLLQCFSVVFASCLFVFASFAWLHFLSCSVFAPEPL